jgi:serine/threonine-protein kinase
VPRETTAAPEQNIPLYAQEFPLEGRDVDGSRRAEGDGDRMYQGGTLSQAATEYKRAFRLNPKPELALKLGEVYWQRYLSEGNRTQLEEARAWWSRHLKDQPDSKARPYIEQAQSLAALPTP